MKILLISPSAPDDIITRTIHELPYLRSDAFFAPHACAVVAALTPAEHQVEIHDEHLHGPVEERMRRNRYDVVGISLLANQLNRTLAIVERYRKLDLPGALVVGGMGAANIYPRLYELADAVFVGEAEQTWPQFLRDHAEGTVKHMYRQIAKPDMSLVPVPRWDLIADDLPRYSSGSVQTNRGCPWDCSFCDVIYTYGRKLRSKAMDQVLGEVRLLASMGTKVVYFADDNFAADRGYCKKLLRGLVALNRGLKSQIGFMAQVDITVAEDPELLQLMLDANVLELQIGIESIEEETLKEFNKHQNLRADIPEAVRTIQSYGIMVLAHMIVGADTDETDCFDRVAQFLEQANIVHHACHPLMAPPGTKLWYELKRQGRIVLDSDELRDRLDVVSNIMPKRMTRLELMEGLADHWLRVTDPAHFERRALGFIQGVRHRPSFKVDNGPSPWKERRMLFDTLTFFGFRADPKLRRMFFKLANEARKISPTLIPKMINVFIFYMMERAQAKLSAVESRAQANYERGLPDGMPLMSSAVPLTDAVRDSAKEIFDAAYRRVRPRIGDREQLYRVVVEAMADYASRFGDTFNGFDDYQLDAVHKSCDRVLESVDPADGAGDGELPEGRPPAGFTREVLDALDQALRVKDYFGSEEQPAAH